MNIPGRALEIRYHRSTDGRFYRHAFKSPVEQVANDDGSVTLRGVNGQTLWADDNEPGFNRWYVDNPKRKGSSTMKGHVPPHLRPYLFRKGHRNPLTRKESADVLKRARFNERESKKWPPRSRGRARTIGRADEARFIAWKWGEAQHPLTEKPSRTRWPSARVSHYRNPRRRYRRNPGVSNLLPFVVFGVVAYFLLFRPRTSSAVPASYAGASGGGSGLPGAIAPVLGAVGVQISDWLRGVMQGSGTPPASGGDAVYESSGDVDQAIDWSWLYGGSGGGDVEVVSASGGGGDTGWLGPWDWSPWGDTAEADFSWLYADGQDQADAYDWGWM